MPIWMKKRRKNWKNARIYEKKLLDKGRSVYATGITDWVGGLGMVTETLRMNILSFAVDNNRCFLFPCFLI